MVPGNANLLTVKNAISTVLATRLAIQSSMIDLGFSTNLAAWFFTGRSAQNFSASLFITNAL